MSPPHYRLDLEALRASITSKSRCILLTNPGNPFGIVYSRAEIAGAIDLARTHNLHIIIDEIYANSTHVLPHMTSETEADTDRASGSEFVSAVDVVADHVAALREGGADAEASTYAEDCDRLVHVLWGMSKDFGANGLRIGVIHSKNEGVQTAMSNLGYMTSGTSTALKHHVQYNSLLNPPA